MTYFHYVKHSVADTLSSSVLRKENIHRIFNATCWNQLRMNRTYQSIETLFELFLIKASLRFEGCLNFFCTLFFIILLFFCSIVKIICNLSRESFIILQLGQINNLHDSVLFYKNLCYTAGKFVHSVVWQHFTLYHIFYHWAKSTTWILPKGKNFSYKFQSNEITRKHICNHLKDPIPTAVQGRVV